jgi:hypothetical protein
MSSKSRSTPSHGLSRPRLPVPLGTERHVDGAGSGDHCSIGPVDRRLAALGGILGFTWWRSRRKRAVLSPPPPHQPDPADELRTKLAEARDADDREEFESGEKPVNEVDVDTKRREAHDRARAAMDDLQSE